VEVWEIRIGNHYSRLRKRVLQIFRSILCQRFEEILGSSEEEMATRHLVPDCRRGNTLSKGFFLFRYLPFMSMSSSCPSALTSSVNVEKGQILSHFYFRKEPHVKKSKGGLEFKLSGPVH
jgi:hypothetical protein